MDDTSAAWQGNWEPRIAVALNRAGCRSVLEYLKRSPGESYLTLAKDLGTNVVAIQIIGAAFKEARAKGELRWTSMDCLVREIRCVFRNGWGVVHDQLDGPLFTEEDRRRRAAESQAEKLTFQKAHVFGVWSAYVSHVPANVASYLEAVWNALQGFSPPIGWIPEGPDDPLIIAAFDVGWPADASIEYLPIGPHTVCPKCATNMRPPGEEDLEQICEQCGTAYPLFGLE